MAETPLTIEVAAKLRFEGEEVAVGALQLRPEDTLVVRWPHVQTAADLANVQLVLRQLTGHQRVMAIPAGVELAVIRAEPACACPTGVLDPNRPGLCGPCQQRVAAKPS